MKRRTSRRWTMLVLALVAWAALPALASAEPKKYFSMTTPASALPSTEQHLKVSLTNDPKSQTTLGSAHIGLPAKFAATRVTTSRGSAALVDGGVRLLNLSLPAGDTVTLTIAALSSDCSGGGAWSVLAKQANDFNGLPGNDFALSQPAGSTSVACANQATESDTEDCADDASGAACTVSIVTTGKMPTAGTLRTVAAESYSVQAIASAFPDPDLDDTGTLTAQFQPTPTAFACAGQTRPIPITTRVVGPLHRLKTLELRLSPSITGTATKDQIEICAAAPVPWLFEGDQGAFLNGTEPLLKGRLADCAPGAGSSPLQPCISSREQDAAGNWVVKVEVPAYPDDPYYH